MNNFNEYEQYIEPALYENPVLILDEIKKQNDNLPLSNVDIIKYITSIRKIWEEYKRQDIQVNIIIKKDNDSVDKEVLIFNLGFGK
ncbi:hypothetical protein GND98_018345 [Clostridium butyricum]|uniref:Uncharacterized protein n=1 Tax=Clostridium butyricum TaxID=1492 RepID=A0A6L9EVK8_CLOBU|nr:hypothetical protein [Clostridium butyricum]